MLVSGILYRDHDVEHADTVNYNWYALSHVNVIYIPWAIKTCHFVFDYNSGFSWSIFILFAPVEEELILYTGVNKIYHFTLTVSTLPGKIKTIYKPHFEVNHDSAFDRTGCSQLMQKVVQCSPFLILSSKNSFISLLWNIFFTFPQVFNKKSLVLSPNSTYLTWRSDCMNQTFVTCDVMQLWRHQVIK